MAKILEISEIFLMADLKAQVENLAIKMINKANVKEFCEKAEKFGCTNLLKACVQLMVKGGISLGREEVQKMPDATVACLEAFKAELNKRNDLEVKLGKQEEELAQLKKRKKNRILCHRCGSDITYDDFCNYCTYSEPLINDY